MYAFTFDSLWLGADCVRFLPSLMEAYKGFEPGKVDIVFVSSDRSKELQQRYMETGITAQGKGRRRKKH